MTPRTPTRSLVRVLIAALLVDGSLASACLHGAQGNEQTSVVNGNSRVDRVRMTSESGQVTKIFVGPKGLKNGSTIRGISLTGEAAELHKKLADKAAAIGREGRPVTRGGGFFRFEGTDVAGSLTELTPAMYRDWAEVAAKLAIPSRGDQDNAVYTAWLRKIRSSGRSAYALQVDASAGGVPMLAVEMVYPGADIVAEIVADKILETTAASGVPSITWFQGLNNSALDQAVGLVAANDGTSELGSNFSYTLPGVGPASLRTRIWTVYHADDKPVERTGILWMR